MTRPLPCDVRLTRTPLAGGASTVLEERLDKPTRRILAASARATQSVGYREGAIVLDNSGGRFDAWESGDAVKLEARRVQDTAYTVLLEGFAGEPEDVPGQRPQLVLPILGADAVLDLVHVAAAKTYTNTAWTNIADDVVSTALPGYTRTITGDAAVASRFEVTKGMKVREVLDLVRRGLIASTLERWEYTLIQSAGTKTFKLYKRDVTVQRTIKARDLRPGTGRPRGSVMDVVNKATVFGATVPHTVLDKTGISLVGTTRIDTDQIRVAQPFTADDTPLYLIAARAARSVALDPPTLRAHVARNSDNLDFIQGGVNAGKVPDVYPTFVNANMTNPDRMTDGDDATFADKTDTAAGGGHNAFQIGSMTYPVVRALRFKTSVSGSPNVGFQILGRKDSGTGHTPWAGEAGDPDPTVINNTTRFLLLSDFPTIDNAVDWVSIFLRSDAGAGTRTWNIHDFAILLWANDSPDSPTNPNGVISKGAISPTTLTTTGDVEKELLRLDFVTARAFAKLALTHHQSVAAATLYTKVQWSQNGTDWTDLAILPSTTTTDTVDTMFPELAAFRHLRLLLVDERAAASPSVTWTGKEIQGYLQTSTAGEPLVGDALKGSEATWTVENLVDHPAELEPHTYPTPRLKLVQGNQYWLVFEADADTQSFWDLEYGTEAGASPVLRTTDAGATWAALAANAVLRHRLAFNNAQLVGEATDATSQTKYNGLVPSGVLSYSTTDESLTTQAMVDNEAAAHVQVRKDVQERPVFVLDFDPGLDVGKRVGLHADVAEILGGLSGDQDVVEVIHVLGPKPTTTLQCNEHPPTSGSAISALAALVSERRA